MACTPRQDRATALFALATELPAAVLAHMLGISIHTAVDWQQTTSGDWMTYAADVSRRNPRQVTSKPPQDTPSRPKSRQLPCRTCPTPRADTGVIPRDSTSRCIRTVPLSDITITDVRTPEELARYFALSELEPLEPSLTGLMHEPV